MSLSQTTKRKTKAMQRMGKAIDRAIAAPSIREKEQAARWAAAWGLLCGIRTSGLRLRGGELIDSED